MTRWKRRIFAVVVALVLGPGIAAAQEYAAQYTPPAPPSQGHTPGATVNVQVTVRNTGTLAWNNTADAQGRYFVLGYHWQGPETTHADVPQAGLLPSNVAPNQIVTVSVPLKVPATPGTYTLQWDMVHLGMTWFTGCCGVTGVGAPNPGAVQTVGVGGPPTLTINPGAVTHLCAIVGCDNPLIDPQTAGNLLKAACGPGPQIAGWVPFSMMRQGGTVALHGKCFGQQGTLRLKGLPGGDVTLPVVEWKHGHVAGSVPTNLAVVGDTPVTLEVTRADGKKATSPSTTFTPLREVKFVPHNAILVLQCANLSGTEWCLDLNKADLATWTIWGYHGWPECFTGCVIAGTDKYTVNLKNNHWLVSANAWKDIEPGESNADLGQATTGHVWGQFYVHIEVPFWYTAWDSVQYVIQLYADGPINVAGW